MKRNLWRVVGASAAVALVGLVAAMQSGVLSRDSTPATETAGSGAPAMASADPGPGLQAEIDRLNGELADRIAAYDALAATVQTREADAVRLTVLLAARDAEIADLRSKLAELQQQAQFDAALTQMKPGPEAGGARIDPVRADSVGPLAREQSPAHSSIGTPAEAPGVPSEGQAAARALSEIHFDPASSRLSPGGEANAAAAAAMLRDMGISRIRVVGYTDRVGGPARNRALAATRARAVADFLVSAGLPQSAIEVVGMGETDPPIATADGVAEPLNRCVTIEVVPI